MCLTALLTGKNGRKPGGLSQNSIRKGPEKLQKIMKVVVVQSEIRARRLFEIGQDLYSRANVPDNARSKCDVTFGRKQSRISLILIRCVDIPPCHMQAVKLLANVSYGP
jgi:hypothetical protein